jgi:hypothetical protein
MRHSKQLQRGQEGQSGTLGQSQYYGWNQKNQLLTIYQQQTKFLKALQFAISDLPF